MASSREERMQQRLRGAQRREVAEVDFGLTFPALSPAVGSNDGEDELATPDPRSTRKMPQQELRERIPKSVGRARTRTPAVEEKKGRNGTKEGNEGSSSAGANISAKRRRLDVAMAVEGQKDVEQHGLLERGVEALATAVVEEDMRTRKSVMSSGGGANADDIYALVEEADELDITMEGTSLERSGNIIIAATRSTTSPTTLRSSSRIPRFSLAQAAASDKLVESPTNALSSGHRTRSSGVLTTGDSTRQLESTIVDGTPTPIPRGSTNFPSASNKRKSATDGIQAPNKVPRKRHSLSRQVEAEDDDIDELSPEQVKPQRRRLVAAQQSFSEDEDQDSTQRDEEADELEEAEAITGNEAAIHLKRNHRRRVSWESPDIEEAATNPKKPAMKQTKHPRKFSSPVQQRQPKSNPTTTKTASNKASKRSKPPTGPPIPVTVHRLTRGPIYDEEESDADILNSDIPHARRGGVNAIDVLNQICQEIIAAGLDTLEQDGAEIEDRGRRREYRTKWKAVEMFGMEMGARLVEHTINLDNVYSLEKRVRDEHRKKLGLRDEILRIRAEREQVALRMDEIRIKHEKESIATQNRDTLNNTLYDIELAIDRGKELTGSESPTDDDRTGMEFVLKQIAGEMCSKSVEGGILKRLKEFNAFLERAAGALEGRRVEGR